MEARPHRRDQAFGGREPETTPTGPEPAPRTTEDVPETMAARFARVGAA